MPSADLQTLVDHIAAEMAQEADRSKVADYIPPLALVSPDRALARVVEKTGWSVFRTDRYGAA